MRFIAIAIVLLILGLLVSRQLTSGPSLRVEEAQRVVEDSGAPRVPTKGTEVEQFGKQMNDYMKAEADKRDAAIDAGSK